MKDVISVDNDKWYILTIKKKKILIWMYMYIIWYILFYFGTYGTLNYTNGAFQLR